MKNLFSIGLALLTLGVTVIGCSSSGAEGGDVPATVTNELQGLGEAAKKAGGDYDKLSAEDKQKFITRTGSEEGAKAMVQRMASPPPNLGAGK